MASAHGDGQGMTTDSKCNAVTVVVPVAAVVVSTSTAGMEPPPSPTHSWDQNSINREGGRGWEKGERSHLPAS